MAYPSVKSNGNEKKDKYMDLTRELKTLKQKGNIDTNLNGALGTATKGLVQGLEDWKIRR